MLQSSGCIKKEEEDLEDTYYTNYKIRDFDQETTVSSEEFKALKTEVKVLKEKSVHFKSEVDRCKIQMATMEASIQTLQNKVAVLEKNNSSSVQNQIDGSVQSVKGLRELQGALQSQNTTVIDEIKETSAPVKRGGGDDQLGSKAPCPSLVRCRSFACPECEIKFPTKANLNMHMVRHTKIPYYFPCKVCSKKFRFIRLLHKHLAEHDTYHSCEHCGKKFWFERTLQLHMKTRHNSNKEGGQKMDRDDKLSRSV
ncbi:unnamed protein product [Orchesella dallaii]|uniref:C2H2-type domain-containing protein n=1 Tax=Orchesella dallaii TaxID=48710 RepID=A0ABP1R2I9_9HEXA